MAYFPNSKGFIILGLILIILLIPIIQVVRPCPVIEAKPISPEIELPGNFSVTFPAQGESAVGTDNLGVIASTDDQTPVPIASVAKIMTAYLVLQTYPLKAGQTGPSLIMNAQDVSDYQFSVKNGHSVLKVEEGESLTEKQLLQGLMLPSANNIANTLARWVSGSEEAFVDKMNETAESLGMKDTHYADASGVSPETVSNAVDQIKIARVAMEDPIFREIVAMPQVTLLVAGTVYNVNYMLGKHGIVGIKTGSTLDAGGCFVSAAPIV
ncbi:MAG: D-alanyl-D-alanine carboxypeptidase, partial [Desulfitobacteriaceae bacterium]|nr:D-alanyl-D-alanine carboxypeptidase [Desulfitobacteriaceae bacterium]